MAKLRQPDEISRESVLYMVYRERIWELERENKQLRDKLDHFLHLEACREADLALIQTTGVDDNTPDTLVQVTLAELEALQDAPHHLEQEVDRLRECLRVLANICKANVEQSQAFMEGV